MHTNISINIPNNKVEMNPGFMIVAAPSGDEQYAVRLGNAFLSGALIFANGQELGTVTIVPGSHTRTNDIDDMNTHDHLDGFVEIWDEDDETYFVEPNSLIIIDHIDTFSPDGDDTFDAIQSWTRKHGARVIGIRHD